MSPAITYAIALLLIVVEALAAVDLIQQKSVRSFIIQTAAVIIAVILLHVTTGFPDPTARLAFGAPFPTLLAVFLMFVGVLLGMAANYVFYQRGRFFWRRFVRPFVISPVVLLPLIGSLQGAELQPVQLVCFIILAFQNGFFWQEVFKDARPTTS